MKTSRLITLLAGLATASSLSAQAPAGRGAVVVGVDDPWDVCLVNRSLSVTLPSGIF